MNSFYRLIISSVKMETRLESSFAGYVQAANISGTGIEGNCGNCYIAFFSPHSQHSNTCTVQSQYNS